MSWFLEKPEKRNHQRIDIDLPVDIIIEGKKISASTSNISCGGMYLPMPKESTLQEHAALEITLSLPSIDKPVKVMGAVNRIDGTDQGIAVEFQGLYDDNILAIERFIKSKLH